MLHRDFSRSLGLWRGLSWLRQAARGCVVLCSTIHRMAVVLLSVATAASACETSCSLKMAGPGCAHSASGHSPSPHAMHNMSRGGIAAMATVDRVITTSCDHAVCEHQPQALVNEKNSGCGQLLALPHVVVLVTLALLPHEHSFVRVSETPPLRPPLLIFLQTTILV
jgi:hypothetical protein